MCGDVEKHPYSLFYTFTKIHIFTLSETHIDNSTPTQLFEIPDKPSLTKIEILVLKVVLHFI